MQHEKAVQPTLEKHNGTYKHIASRGIKKINNLFIVDFKERVSAAILKFLIPPAVERNELELTIR